MVTLMLLAVLAWALVGAGLAGLEQAVATLNRPVIDRGLFSSTRTHGQEGADRGYHRKQQEPTAQKTCRGPRHPLASEGKAKRGREQGD